VKPIQIKGFRGINNLQGPESIQAVPGRDDPLVELADAVNVDIDDRGGLRRRLGQSLLIPGEAHSLYADGEHCVYIQGDMMYSLDRSMVPTAVAMGLDPLPMAYVTVGNRVYHTNGSDSAVFEDGYVRSWGIPLAATAVAASATLGHLPAGAYLFAMTLLREDGQESGTGMAGRIDLPDNSGLVFSWDVPRDPGIMRAVLYLSQADAETLFLAAEADAGAGQYTYTGGPRSIPLATQWLDQPPAGRALAFYKGRIYIARGEFLYATTALSYEHCDLRDYRAIDGSAILLLAAVESGLFVSTSHAVYFLSGSSFGEGALVKKLDVPAVAGSMVHGDAGEILGNPQLAGQVAAMFATSLGIVLGLPDGTLLNLTGERYQLPPVRSGAALLRPGPDHHYLLALDA
jgi:hypothetical protein